MKTIRFTAYPYRYTGGYRCSEPGDQSGEYVKAEEAQKRIAELEKELSILRADMRNIAFTAAEVLKKGKP